MLRIGLISDTHGLVRPEALAALRGADRLVHAGDIGTPEVLDALRALAPLTAILVKRVVRGVEADRQVPDRQGLERGGDRQFRLSQGGASDGSLAHR